MLAVLAGADNPIATAEIQARIPGEPAYTTINTILFRLHAKHLVTRAREGRHYLYRLAVDESLLVADRMHGHLRHASDPCTVLSRFVQNLTADEERALRDVLGQAHPGTVEDP